MSQSLTQQQQQTLRLSPQQVRFGRVLEMSAPEFEEEVARALDEMPALQPADDAADTVMKDDEGNCFSETADQLQRADYASDDDVPYHRLYASNRSADDPAYDFEPADDPGASYPSLESQLSEQQLPDDVHEVASFLISSLDDNGFLTRRPAELADDMAMSLGIDVSPAAIEQATKAVRRLEPAGIGARNLREALMLQLRRLPQSAAVRNATRILTDNFDDLARKSFTKIRTMTGLDEASLREAVALIRSLNPRPAALLEGPGTDDRTRHITPDFVVEPDEEGELTVSLGGHVPELEVAPSFKVATAKMPGDDGFIARQRTDAEAFIGLARRRADTLMAVIRTIIALQPRYFDTFDRADLRPMVLRDIADRTGFDLSVISRATNAKYILTPAGIVRLKSLFSEKVNPEAEVSSHGIKDAIRELVAAEDPAAPLSDDAICDALAARGMTVARRTVAKYRESMGIASSRTRRNKL